jgi:hypothetical protein
MALFMLHLVGPRRKHRVDSSSVLSLLCVCVYVYLLSLLGNGLVKHVLVVKNTRTHAKVELLHSSASSRSTLSKGSRLLVLPRASLSSERRESSWMLCLWSFYLATMTLHVWFSFSQTCCVSSTHSFLTFDEVKIFPCLITTLRRRMATIEVKLHLFLVSEPSRFNFIPKDDDRLYPLVLLVIIVRKNIPASVGNRIPFCPACAQSQPCLIFHEYGAHAIYAPITHRT